MRLAMSRKSRKKLLALALHGHTPRMKNGKNITRYFVFLQLFSADGMSSFFERFYLHTQHAIELYYLCGNIYPEFGEFNF